MFALSEINLMVYNGILDHFRAINFTFLFVAHEITHAFDDAGIMYDMSGANKPLYDEETVER